MHRPVIRNSFVKTSNFEIKIFPSAIALTINGEDSPIRRDRERERERSDRNLVRGIRKMDEKSAVWRMLSGILAICKIAIFISPLAG
jgi:hypothetical protein